ncbi:MAG: thiamine phosphate synthase [Desulfovibrionaceae bacterium]|nr:thiamine phosphate synthase [Desulfovibrionaceae bacterium]
MSIILPGETDLYAITDERLSLGRSLEEVARELLGAGIRILQYREKKMHDGEMLEKCRLLRRITREYDACFIVDDHVDIALLSHADGVHVGQNDIPLYDVRTLVGSVMVVGVSTHEPEQAKAAFRDGADYIGVGPIYATKTKEDVVSPVGLSYLDWVKANIDMPFVCIGGIKAHNIHDVVEHGAQCCALVSEFVSAPNIGEAVQKVRKAMHS